MRAIYHYTHAFYTYISLLMNARRRQLLHKRKLNWKHMCCPVQEFRMVWEVGGGCRVLLWMRVLVMGERKTQEGGKNLFVGGGSEGLAVGRAWEYKLRRKWGDLLKPGNSMRGWSWGVSVSGLNLNHIAIINKTCLLSVSSFFSFFFASLSRQYHSDVQRLSLRAAWHLSVCRWLR